MSAPAPEQIKQQQHQTWSSVADGWGRRYAMLRRCSANVTARMLELAGVVPGAAVLDVASGSGEPAISAAQRVGAGGRVQGTDLVEDMLVHARAHAAAAGLTNIEFQCVDGEMLDFGADTFDAATLRWGLMFMPDRVGALKRVHRSLRGGTRIALATWAEPERNPFVTLALDTLGKYREIPPSPPDGPGIFALADRNKLAELLQAAGFDDITVEDMAITPFEADTAEAYWEILSDLAGPISVLYNEMDERSQAAFVRDFARGVEERREGEKVGLPGVTWIAAGKKPP